MTRQPLFIASALLGLVLVSCGDRTEHAAAKQEITPKPVTVALVERSAAPGQTELVGTVTARTTADIQTKVQARVERIPVALGSRVDKGDLLAELDAREFRARVAQAKAVYEQTSQDLKRFERLLSQQAATQQEFDGVKARQAVAEATLNEAEAMLSYARVVAPFSGVVTRKTIDVGDLIVPGKPLFTLEESGSPRFVATIPEGLLGRLAVGDSVGIAVAASDTVLRGRVAELSPSADPISRTYEAKVDLPSVTGVRNGQFGRLLLASSGEHDGLFVPVTAVVQRGQLDLVYVVTVDNRATLRLVKTGRVLGDKVEILSGLEDAERVVISGQSGLSDGDPVEAQS